MIYDGCKSKIPDKKMRTVSDKGQTVIPKSSRDYMDIHPGDQLIWTVNEKGDVTVTAYKRRELKQLKGIVKPKVPVTDMDEVIRQSKEDRADG